MSTKRAIIAPPEKNRRRSRNIQYASLALVAIIIVVAVALASRQPKTASNAPVQASVKVGDVAPPFSVSTTNGPFDLKTVEASGKPVFLEVFATWCPHCQREVATINGLYKQYGNKVAFVGVAGSQYAIDGSSPETQLDVVGFGQQYHVQYPIAFDPTLDVASKYLQGGFPTIVVIDKSGKIAYMGSGELDAKDLANQLNKVT